MRMKLLTGAFLGTVLLANVPANAATLDGTTDNGTIVTFDLNVTTSGADSVLTPGLDISGVSGTVGGVAVSSFTGVWGGNGDQVSSGLYLDPYQNQESRLISTVTVPTCSPSKIRRDPAARQHGDRQHPVFRVERSQLSRRYCSSLGQWCNLLSLGRLLWRQRRRLRRILWLRRKPHHQPCSHPASRGSAALRRWSWYVGANCRAQKAEGHWYRRRLIKTPNRISERPPRGGLSVCVCISVAPASA